MFGYNKLKFLSLPKSLEEELTCGICLNIFNTPVSTPCCRNSYCKQCILKSLQPKSSTCPTCRRSLISTDLLEVPRCLTNILDKQEVFCDYKSSGCPEIIRLSELSHHLIQCSFGPNKASIKCKQSLKRLSESVDTLKNKIRRQEFDELKKELDLCNEELTQMSAKIKPQTIYVVPDSTLLMERVIDLAQNDLHNYTVIKKPRTSKSSTFVNRLIKCCKDAIRGSDNYKEITDYLVDNLSDTEYKWTVFVSQKESAHHMIENCDYKFEICFDKLNILLIGYYRQEDDSQNIRNKNELIDSEEQDNDQHSANESTSESPQSPTPESDSE